MRIEHERVVAELAKVLYPVLPGSGARSWGKSHAELTFPGVAGALGLSKFWPGGSKEPAIVALLLGTLEYAPARFSDLITEVVRRGIRKGSAKITRELVAQVIGHARRLGYGVPELERPEFRSGLPSADAPEEPMVVVEPTSSEREALRRAILSIAALSAQPRGYALEALLTTIWNSHGLHPRAPYRLIGEQIDGSFEFEDSTYIVEARWREHWADIRDLDAFQNKVARKSQWTRGLFVSYAGFSPEGLVAFSKGQATRILGMTGQDLYHLIFGDLQLREVLRRKRRAADEGRGPCVSVSELFAPG